MNVSFSDNSILRVQFLYVIHDVRNFNEHINDIDIRVDNVRGQMKTGSQLKLILFS